MNTVAGLVLAYFLGSIPFGYIVTRALKGKDIRKAGSGNVGATNVFRVAGPAAGIATGLLDLGKGWLAVAVMHHLTPDASTGLLFASGLCAIAGHNWSIWLGFSGGRGVDTTAGVFLYLAWLPLLGAVGVFVLFFLVTRMVSLGSLAAATALPLLVLAVPASRGNPVLLGAAMLASAIVWVRHIPNIRRLAAGKEYQWGRARKAGRPRRRQR